MVGWGQAGVGASFDGLDGDRALAMWAPATAGEEAALVDVAVRLWTAENDGTH